MDEALSRLVWKAERRAWGEVDNVGDKTRRHFGDPLEPCACGSYPKFRSNQVVVEDVVESRFVCACGVEGPEVEDAYADRRTASLVWDMARRRERRPVRVTPVKIKPDKSRQLLRYALAEVQDNLCAYCFAPMEPTTNSNEPASITIDEVVPRVLDGSPRAGNVVAAHYACNHAKGGRMPNGCELLALDWVSAKLAVRK